MCVHQRIAARYSILYFPHGITWHHVGQASVAFSAAATHSNHS